jgi:hypothetical protein
MANETEDVKKESGIIPEEYVLKNKEYSIDEWRKQKIADALKYQESRETGADVPNWWGGTSDDIYYSDKYGIWNNCLATATGAFGDKYCESGNKTFINPKASGYFQKKGFRELTDGEQLQHGDLLQLFYDRDGREPFHMLMYTGDDDSGRLYTYGTGTENIIRKNRRFPIHDDGPVKYYRFTGTEDDIAEIEAHNAKVRKFNEETAPLREKREVTLIPTKPIKAEPIDTARWLRTLPKRN